MQSRREYDCQNAFYKTADCLLMEADTSAAAKKALEDLANRCFGITHASAQVLWHGKPNKRMAQVDIGQDTCLQVNVD
jgi:hypothetical protein